MYHQSACTHNFVCKWQQSCVPESYMLIINGKQFQRRAWQCSKEGTLSRQTKSNKIAVIYEEMRRLTNFEKKAF